MRIVWCVSLVLTLLTFDFCKYEANVKYDYFYSGVYVFHHEKDSRNEVAEQVFSCIASVICTSVKESGVVFDLKMTSIHMTPKDYNGTVLGDFSSVEIDRNFSKPFSFTLLNDGSIGDVKCLENENEEVIQIKSAIVGEFVTLGENETDELPVKTLDLQGVYMSHWKRERKGEGIEMLTREYTDEDFIHFRSERNTKDGLIIDFMEKKKIKSGVIEKSSSEGQVYIGGSKFNPAKRKMVHKKGQDSIKEEYNGSEIYVVESTSMELFKTSNVPNLKRRSLNDDRDLKQVNYMHWGYYNARATKKVADGKGKRTLGGWDDLYLDDDASLGADAGLGLCPGEDENLATIPGETVVRPPWVSDSATSSRRRLALSLDPQAQEALHDEFERNMTRGFSSDYKSKMKLNGLIDVDQIKCPEGLGMCFNWHKAVQKGDNNFGLDFLANLTMGHVPGCHKNCNFGIEIDTHLFLMLFGKQVTIFNFSFGASNIDGFHRNNHIHVDILMGAKNYGPCKFNDVACVPHYIELIPPIKIPLDKLTPPLAIDQEYDLKVVKIKVVAGVTMTIGIVLEVTVCPAFGLASIGPLLEIAISVGLAVQLKIAWGDFIDIDLGGVLNATTKFLVGPVLGIDFSRDVLFLNAKVQWNPLYAILRCYAHIKFLFIKIDIDKQMFEVTLKPIVIILFEITYPLPWDLFNVKPLDPAVDPAVDPAEHAVYAGASRAVYVADTAEKCETQTRNRALANKPNIGNYSITDASGDILADLLTNKTVSQVEKAVDLKNLGKE